MKHTLNVCLLLTAAVAREEESSRAIVFSDVTVVDVESGRLLPNRSVAIDGTKISAVSPTENFKAQDGMKGPRSHFLS